MVITFIKKKLPFFLLAIILVLTGGLALTSADTSEISVDSGNTSQNELRLERPDFLAESTTDNNSVYLLAEDEPEDKTAGPNADEKAIWKASEQEGPPPWAGPKKDIDNEWFDGDRQSPPPWAGPKKDKPE